MLKRLLIALLVLPLPAWGQLPTHCTDTAGLDTYCGITALPSTGGATGYFYVEKSTSGRWMFVDPLGNYFWLLSIYSASHGGLDSRVATKYGGNWVLWDNHRNSRILSWNFNTLGEYDYNEGLPIDRKSVV